MQKFINVQKLADYLTEEAKNYLEDNSVQCTIAAGVVCSVKEDILRMPTANVVEAGKIEQIKSEAVKEFAERLKEKAHNRIYRKDIVYEVEIDNLVKEMVGEDDESIPC